MNQGEGNGTIWIDFDSTTEMVDFCDRAEPVWSGGQSSRRSMTSFPDWFESKLFAFSDRELVVALRTAANAVRQTDMPFIQQRTFDRDLRTALRPTKFLEDKIIELVRETELGPAGFFRELEFLGTRTWAEAVDLARYGWREGREKLFSLSLKHPPFAIEPVRQAMLDYAGFMPDIPEYLSGNPEHMRDERIIMRQSGNIFRFHLSAQVNANVSAKQLENGGAAVVSLIDAMEASGCRIELNWIAVSEAAKAALPGPSLIVRVRLKEADQPLDMDRLAFWCMHPGATRRMEFAVDERLDVEKWYGGNYGRAITDPVGIRQHIPEDEILLTIGAGFPSVDSALAHIKSQLPKDIGELVDC
jgi:hypothetical protein